MMNKRLRVQYLIIPIVLILLIGTFYSLPFYVSKPGMAKELNSLIEVENGFDEEGSFMLTTVRMGRANIYSFLIAKFSDYQKIYPLEDIMGEEESEEEYNVRQLHLMDSSKLSAIEVAYKKAGIPVKFEYKGVYVLNVVESMPAHEKLLPGDRIFKVDNQDFSSSDEFIQYVSEKEAGEVLTLTYERGNKVGETEIAVQTFPEDKTKVGIGIGLVDDKEIQVEPDVEIHSDEIGGPSAGFMFALEIYNQLTKEDMTRGYHIAGTGTISSSGKIGRIGGIEQKIVAADRAGAEIFFAPNEEGIENSNYSAAVKAAEDIGSKMKIVPVDNFNQAVDYLEDLS